MTTKKKRRKKSVKKLKYSNKKLNFVHVATLAGVILILLVIILAARGCGGISHRTPEGLMEGYIKAAVAGKDTKMARIRFLMKRKQKFHPRSNIFRLMEQRM